MLYDNDRIVAAERQFDSISERLKSSLKEFVCYCHDKMNNGTPILWPCPPGRRNHIEQIIEVLERTALGQSIYQTINIPSRYGKTLLIIYYIAWCYANRPNANFLYFSHNVTLAAEQTEEVLRIMNSSWYKRLFDVRISKSSSAKGNFKTTDGGHTTAVGADGGGIGRGAGLIENVTHAGALMLDDVLTVQESYSAAARKRICRVYQSTWKNRRNNPSMTPIINISQRTNQGDMTGNLHGGKGLKPLDGEKIGQIWRDNALVIPALDVNDNPLWPERHSKEWLLDLKQNDPHTFYSIYQQSPISDASRVFKIDLLKELKEEPDFVCTFIVGDTAETDKNYNDPTAIGFFGLYKIKSGNEDTGLLGLHIIDIIEIRVEPEDLEVEFDYFHMKSMRHKKKPTHAFIEEKSTGVTLVSHLRRKPGLNVVPIKRTAASGSKISRFARTAPFVAKSQVSILRSAPHNEKFKEHMGQIAFDGSHKHDDIADITSDAIDLGLIDKVLYNIEAENEQNDESHALSEEDSRVIDVFRRN